MRKIIAYKNYYREFMEKLSQPEQKHQNVKLTKQ